MKSDIEEIIEAIKEFRDARNWKQFHDAKNLAINLNIESAELLENYLWKDSKEADKVKVSEELADVFYTAFLLADELNLNVRQIISEKLTSNELKYPIDKAKGSNRKYNQL